MEVPGVIHNREIHRTFDNGKPRKTPRVTEWQEEVIVFAFVALPSGEVVAVVRRSWPLDSIETFPLNEGHRYGTKQSGKWLTVP